MKEFNFKKLKVWEKGMDFTEKCFHISDGITGHYRIREQLESAAASIPQNIAEGDGRTSIKDNINFLGFSRGSVNEAITILNVLQRRKHISDIQLTELESLGMEIILMLNKLISVKIKLLK